MLSTHILKKPQVKVTKRLDSGKRKLKLLKKNLNNKYNDKVANPNLKNVTFLISFCALLIFITDSKRAETKYKICSNGRFE